MVEPSAAARQVAFQILSAHPECLRDDVSMNDLIDRIAMALDNSRHASAQVSTPTEAHSETPTIR